MIRAEQSVPARLADAVNLHLVADVHCQNEPTAQLRLAKVVDDAARMVGRNLLDAHLVMGDLTNAATGSEAALWAAWRDTLGGDVPVHVTLGNHDVGGSWTAQQAAAALGLPAPNYVVDTGPVRLIFLSLAVTSSLMVVPADGLAFLDAALGGTTVPCLIVFHAPLAETVGGPPGWNSGEPFIRASSNLAGGDGELRQILAGHPNAIGWVSGHNHSPIEAPGLLTVVDVGHQLAAVSTPGLWFTNPDIDPHGPLRGLLLSVLDERTVEVRFRDHGAGVWTAPAAGEHVGRKTVRIAL